MTNTRYSGEKQFFFEKGNCIPKQGRKISYSKEETFRDFPGGPVAKILPSQQEEALVLSLVRN